MHRKLLIKERNLSLGEAASEMNISHTTVSRLLAGKSPDLD